MEASCQGTVSNSSFPMRVLTSSVSSPKAAKRSLVDEYHLRLRAHYKNDYEIKKCFGLHGGNEERLWISEYVVFPLYLPRP